MSYGSAARASLATEAVGAAFSRDPGSNPSHEREARATTDSRQSLRLFKKARVEPGRTGVRNSAFGLRLSYAFTPHTRLNHLHDLPPESFPARHAASVTISIISLFLCRTANTLRHADIFLSYFPAIPANLMARCLARDVPSLEPSKCFFHEMGCFKSPAIFFNDYRLVRRGEPEFT